MLVNKEQGFRGGSPAGPSGGGASNPVSKRRGPTGVQHIKDISQSIPAAAKCGY